VELSRVIRESILLCVTICGRALRALTTSLARQPRYYEADVTLEDGSEVKQMVNEQENLVKVNYLS
jgi:hypothetical protein